MMRIDLLNRRRLRVLGASLRGVQGERGGALVELALTLPLLFVIILGVAEFGGLAYAGIEISSAARAGAAYGAQTHNTAKDAAGIKNAATKDSKDFTMSSTPAVTLSCACSNAPSSAIACSTAQTGCASPHRVIQYVTVTTSGTVNPVIHVPGLIGPYTIQGTAVMQVVQ